MYQFDVLDIDSILDPIVSVIILLVLMVIMLMLYRKVKIWVVVAVMWVFSLMIGFVSLDNDAIPYNPYVSWLFIAIQSIFFILISYQVYKR